MSNANIVGWYFVVNIKQEL